MGIINLSQERKVIYREADQRTGTMAAPVFDARRIDPGWAILAGP
jgi:hypothetical protein